MDYKRHSDQRLNENYSQISKNSRKELVKMDMETKAYAGLIDWNNILNDFK